MDSTKNGNQIKIKVWDLPTRLFHWLLVTVFVFQFVTGDILDDAMQLHFYGGYVALGLILFRIIWGMVGSYHARFTSFLASPVTAWQYMRGKSQTHRYLGHNPLGAYSVLALLAVMLTQAVSGLFMTDEIFSQGPYYSAVSSEVADIMNWLHHQAFSLLWYLIALHLIAIAYYRIKKKQKLVKAMFTGNKEVDEKQSNQLEIAGSARNIKTHWLRFLIVVALVVLAVYLIVEVLPPAPEPGLYDYY
uniref:cytochrome b/b6 domain-containing protein n=1 Tax=Ningiella ruwaisensis TaxID=2364274 RepID=UPI0010A089EC|nr:cytochrome b/b6 domain-containing protein [Ningiella ruwaisensis]